MAEPTPDTQRTGFSGFLGVTLLICVALAAAGLTWQYLRARPLNLRPHALQVAGDIEALLADAYVPAAGISRDAGELEEDPNCSWYRFHFAVTVPATLNADGVREGLASALIAQYAGALEIYDDAANKSLGISLSGRMLAEVVFEAVRPPPPPKADLRPACAHAEDQARRLLREAGLPEALYQHTAALACEDETALWTFHRGEVLVPPDAPLEGLDVRLADVLRVEDASVRFESDADATVLCVSILARDCLELTCRPLEVAEEELPLDSAWAEPAEPEPEGEPPAKPGVTPRVAIIIDDGGYGGGTTSAVLALDPRLTLAILPNTPSGTETAARAAERGFEVILHMPMENGTLRPYPGELSTAMATDEIRRLTEEALAQVPGAAGVNNHTGSVFTANADSVRAFLNVVKEHGLYFVDSRTSGASLAAREARTLGIPAGRRYVFLDHELNHAFISKQFQQLITEAKRAGSAIGIGHFRKVTAEALAELIPTLETQGVQLVHASELMR